jgi:hypothetical protein
MRKPVRRSLSVAVAAAWLWCGMAAATSSGDFMVNTTHDIVVLCTTPETDPMYSPAVSFCHGYLVGAWHYHKAVAHRRKREIVCLPDPPPTRLQAIQQFLDWCKANPQYDAESPIETLFKFLVEKYPCRA